MAVTSIVPGGRPRILYGMNDARRCHEQDNHDQHGKHGPSQFQPIAAIESSAGAHEDRRQAVSVLNGGINQRLKTTTNIVPVTTRTNTERS